MATNCVVTGAAGFIGSHLVDRLLSLGYRVVGIDNLLLGRMANLASASKDPKFRFGELDITDTPRVLKFLRQEMPEEGFQTVWHMAANSDIQAGGIDPDVDLKATFLTTYHVLKVMKDLSIPEIAFASSSAIYGEHDGLLREETGPLFPISNYGAMKLASEGVISAALETIARKAWIFRFPNVVGSRSTHGVIYDFLKKLKRTPQELEVLGDGTQQKPYLHVSELIDAMLMVYERSKERLNCFNIACPDSSTTVRYIAEAVVRVASPQARIRYTGGSRGWIGDVPKFEYSIAKVQKLGWSPKMSSNDAIELAIRENLNRVQ